VPVLAGAGFLLMLAGGWRARVVALALWGGGALSYLHNELGDTQTFSWYLVYLVVGLVISLAWVADVAAGKWRRFAVVPVGLIVAGYGFLVWAPINLVAHTDRQPMAAVAERVRGERHAFGQGDGGVLTGTFGVSDRQMLTYDPRVQLLKEQADLEVLVRRAREQGKVLYIYFCGEAESRGRCPEIMRAVTGGERFEKMADIRGVEAYYSYQIYRLVPAAEP